MLPVLILETTCSALVLLDGTPLGESGPGQPVTLPLSPSCVHYLEARPLVPGRIPLTRRFELDGSELDPTSLAGDVRAGSGQAVLRCTWIHPPSTGPARAPLRWPSRNWRTGCSQPFIRTAACILPWSAVRNCSSPSPWARG